MDGSVLLFKALGDETRLRILNLLLRGELCVCDIMKILEMGQSKVSRHLAYLRNAGLVTDRREGLWMHYSLAQPKRGLHGSIIEWLTQAENDIPNGTADLRALDDLNGRGELCAECPPEKHNQPSKEVRR